jgi:hypothetical protein
MTGSTLNQPSGSEPVTTPVAGCRLTRLAKAGVASVFGVPDYNFGILDAVIARLGPATSGRTGSQWRPRADSAPSSPTGRGSSISPPSPAPAWWRP